MTIPQQAPKTALIRKPRKEAGRVVRVPLKKKKKRISVDEYKVSLVRAFEIVLFLLPCLKSHVYVKNKSLFDGNVWSCNEFVSF